MRQEFVQRRVEQPDRHRQPAHDLEQRDEIVALHRQQLRQRDAAGLLVVGEDHLAHGADAALVEEHVLGAAQADAFRPEPHGDAGVVGRVGIGANLELAHLVGPAHQGGEFARQRRLLHGDLAGQHLAGRAVDGDDLALLERYAAGAQRVGGIIDADRAGAGDAGLAHAARHHRGMGCHAAAGGENAFRGMHAVDVFGAGLDPHQDDLAPLRLQQLGFVGGEHDLAGGRARRGRQAGGDHLARGAGIDGRMQELVERAGVDPRHRLRPRDQSLVGEFDRDAQRRLGGALAGAGLQHPQLALLHREFEVLHVAVMLFEQAVDAGELGEGRRHRMLERGLVRARLLARDLGDLLGRADAGDDVLALGVDEEFAVEPLLAGRGIAGEGDAGRGGLAHVAEHHRLDIDRRAPAFGNGVEPAIGDGALVHPGAEYGADGAPQLIVRILRERRAMLVRDEGLVTDDERRPVVGVELGVEHIAVSVLVLVEDFLEQAMFEAEHHVRIHGDEAPVGIIGEAAVAGIRRERLDGDVVEAEIEHGVHHAGHRGARARSHRDQQRVVAVAEPPAGDVADLIERGIDLRL